MRFIFIIAAGLFFINNAYADYPEQTVTIKTRSGVTQSFLYIKPEKPKASVVLFAGYDGYLNITKKGIGAPSNNFLVRTRQKFANHGFAVVVIDSPSDRKGMLDWRTSTDHAKDIKHIIAWLRMRVKKSVWLVGTSRGTISAASVAARLQHGGPDGIVLTATVTVAGGSNSGNVRQVKLNKITAPVFIVHHHMDDCYVTPYKGAYELLRKFGSARATGFLGVRGGKSRGSDSCGPLTEHGFSGIEQIVVKHIALWIESMS